jgi:hypothetical protein
MTHKTVAAARASASIVVASLCSVRSTTQSGRFDSSTQCRGRRPDCRRFFAQAFRAETLSMRHYGRNTKKVSVCPLRGQQHRVGGRGASRGITARWRKADGPNPCSYPFLCSLWNELAAIISKKRSRSSSQRGKGHGQGTKAKQSRTQET